eukprot:4679701-Amphidinium_carterae.1
MKDSSDWCERLRQVSAEYQALSVSVPGHEHASPATAVAADLAGKRYVDPDILSGSLRRQMGALAQQAPSVQNILRD